RGNVVRRDSTRVEEAGCLRISEHFLMPCQECSGAEHFSPMSVTALWMLTVLCVGRRGGEPATTLEVVTHAGHHARECSRQHRRGQFKRKSRIAADGGAQQSAAVAVRLKAVVLNPGVKRRCGGGIDTERKPCAFIPNQYRFIDPDADEPLRAARANA